MLEVKGLDVFYGSVQALWDVSIRIEEGEVVSLIGSNGAGKSTLVKTIMGFLKPSRGEILFGNKEIHNLPIYDRIKLGLALVPEQRMIFTNMSVRENLLLGAYLLEDKDEIEENLKWVYSVFPRLKERENQKAGTMSGGEQQMLAIARALISRPKLLILDEPSLGLAPVMVIKVFETLKKLNEEGITMLISAQNIKKALEMSSYGYVIETGRVTLHGDARNLLKNEKVKEAYLGI